MSKKLIAVVLITLLVQLAFARPVAASTKSEKEARFAEKVKVGIATLGTGTNARVEVKLKDKRKLKGYVSEAGADSFTVIDARTNATTAIPYPQVKTVKGNNLSEGTRIAIVLGVLATVIIVIFVAASKAT